MKEPFVVREYDSIICENENVTTEYYRQMPETDFKRLEDFIRNYSSEEDEADALDFMSISYNKRGLGDVIHVKNYVGMIQMQDGSQIEILPKISFDEEGSDKTKEVFLKMLRSMKDFPGKVYNNANLSIDRMNLYEIFISMYISEVRELAKKGLKSAYIQQEDNLRYYKGKLVVSEHIRQNMVHKEKFYVSYDEYQVNRPENRLIKATLLKLQKITSDNYNAKEIRQLLSYFELVDTSANYQKDFTQVIIDRNTREYELILLWSKVFLMNKSFTTFAGEDAARALLFPMEKVFEAYVADNLRRIMRGSKWHVSTQDKGFYLFESPRKQFALRPDIVLEKHGEAPIILDTKWKRLVNDARKNYGISQADMYQMYAYGKKYNASEIWLLYPKTEEMNNMNGFVFDSGDGIKVHLFFVDVSKIDKSILELKNRIERM